jgi:cytochrome c553
MMKKTAFLIFVALLLPCVAAVAAAPVAAADSGDRAEIRALRQQVEELEKSAYHPELGEQMLILQIRHARLWFAGEAGNWNLATFEVQELQEAFDAVVAHNPDDANLQPERLADVLPAMTREPIAALRKAVDGKSKDAFEKAYDGLSAACTGCHRVAGNDMLVIQRPKTPLLDNLRVTPIK